MEDRSRSWTGAKEFSTKISCRIIQYDEKGSYEEEGRKRVIGRTVNFVVIVETTVSGIILVSYNPPEARNDTLASMESVHDLHPQMLLYHHFYMNKYVLMSYAITVRV